MTAKRFTETVSTGIVTDNLTGKEYRCEMRIDKELLDLLNELHEGNTHLNNIISAIEKGSCRSIDSFLDDYCTDEMLKEFDLE